MLDKNNKEICINDIVREMHKGECFVGRVVDFKEAKKLTKLVNGLVPTVQGLYIIDPNNYEHWSWLDPNYLTDRTIYEVIGRW